MDSSSVLFIVALGVWHGVNPGMGWLFAVALGMQEKSGRAVWRALPPLALGHALAVAGALAVAVIAGSVVPPHVLRGLVALALAGFGIERLVRARHPRFGGMRVGPRDLVIWSCLMASAHGAGLMVVPFALSVTTAAAHAGHTTLAGATGAADASFMPIASLLHTAGYLAATGLIALIVYRRAAIGIIRRAWVNLDVVWAVALLGTAALTLL